MLLQGSALTFAELDKRANQLAHSLVALGVGPEVPVGVMMDRSLNLIVALLGVLKAGGAYVPMDPSYPPDRLALMMEDSEASLCRVLRASSAAITLCAEHTMSAAGARATERGGGFCTGACANKGTRPLREWPNLMQMFSASSIGFIMLLASCS